MAHVLLKYSVPVYSGDKLLDGSVDSTIRGYQNFAVSIRTNHPARQATAGIYVPTDYYLTGAPQVTLNPPKTGLCDVVAVSTNFSATPRSTVLERRSGSIAGVS